MIISKRIQDSPLIFIIILLIISSYPSLVSATGFTYYVKGSAFSESNYDTVNLTGFMRFDAPYIESNHIEELVSNNTDSITLTYDILESNILNESNEVFSTGSGKLFINFLKTGQDNWDNYSTWKCGNIQDSLCEGDVYFENKQLLNLLDYDLLPSTMFLNFGIVFNKYFYIDLTLTRDVMESSTQVPEPSTLILILIGMLFFINNKHQLSKKMN